METIFEQLWEDYTQLNSQALRIYGLLQGRGENIVNDHIALRTFQHPKVGIDVLAKPFLLLGYEAKDDYQFTDKKLYAKHYEHPQPNLPKIFISELKIKDFSTPLQRSTEHFLDHVAEDAPGTLAFLHSGTHWPAITYDLYQRLRQESEYAAWMAAFGFRPNHFTVLVNALNSFQSLQDLNQFIKQQGFTLNSAGGEIKGSSKVWLEQSSTMAAPKGVSFADKDQEIPGCYYEFAYRHPLPSGELYQGFVAQSADKIFESTDNKAGNKNDEQ
jgi:hypothetical protein